MDQRRRKTIRRTRTPIGDNFTTQLKKTTESDEFFNKPIVRKVTKTILISGTVLGVLYLSKYFLSATAGMIKSCKELRDAWRQ